MNRAVIYCRVSTEEEKQINALEKQIDEARNAVISNGWLLVDEYVDEGKSGTMIKYRDEFIRLSDDIVTIQTKYYIEDNLLYLCNRDSGTVLTHRLADLVGIYVISA